MTKKQKIALFSVIGLLSAGLLGSVLYIATGNSRGNGAAGGGSAASVYDEKNSSERDNVLSLAKRYMERGEYERAMNLLDTLLIKDANDEDALNLMDEIITLREKIVDSSSQNNTVDNTNSELQQTLEEMAEANRAAAAQNAAMSKRS